MKLLVLAAGYATRLYPLTLTQAKPLLPVAGKPMIEYVLDNLGNSDCIDEVYLVSNARFVDQFHQWSRQYRPSKNPLRFTVLNDGSTDETNRLGAIGDIAFALEHAAIVDDLVVVGGDNLFSQPLNGFLDYCRERAAPVTGVYDVGSLESVKKFSGVTLADDNRIVAFEEKPARPSSPLIGVALYYYPHSSFPLIRQYLADGNNPDQPGRLIQWLYPQTAVYGWPIPGTWYDIGSKETLAEANRIFA